MEHKSSREKAWVASKNRKNNVIANDGSNSEINNLQDDSFIELEELEEEPVPLTEEEKLEIRKKIGILLVIVAIAFVIMIIILIFDPFAPKKSDKNPKEQEEEQEEEEEITLYDYEDGNINLGDKYVTSIYREIHFNTLDNYEFDTTFLFKSSNTSINTLTDYEKTMLAAKSNDFTTMMEKISTSGNICEEKIDVEASELNNILQVKYGTLVTPVKAFKYNYYYDDSYVTSIIFRLDNNTYHGQCYDHSNKLVKMVDQKLIAATKKGDNLYLDVKVVFISEKGVYKDASYKTLITNNKSANADTYFTNANTFRYSYILSEDGYYLNSVSLVK